MKKILLIALGACMLTATSEAQNLKQSGGEKNLQVLFAPLGGQPVSINGISFRKFNATGDAAWRLNVFIGMSNSTEVLDQPIDTGSFSTSGGRPQADANSSSFTIGLRPGYEMHMAGTERLSPYWGAELLFSMTSMSVDSEFVRDNSSGGTTANPTPVAATAYNVLTTESKGDGASTTFGLNLIAGVDYYIAKNLSLGVELGFGFSMTSMPDVETQNVTRNTTSGAWEVKDARVQKQGSSMQVGPNAVGQLKLGWLF